MCNNSDYSAGPSLAPEPIGIIHTPWQEALGTPLQSSMGEEFEGFIEIYPQFVDGLRDIEGIERLWLIYFLHRAVQPQLLVRPYLDPTVRGVFATRAPSRPNQIGLSCVRLLAREANRLRISAIDILDQTPLLDIKPYVPDFDSFPSARTGWYEGRIHQSALADNRFTTTEK
jgi:tRNA-Thr(GGU) m(6)t(6)A37 methyltransferase TsaA